MTDDRAWRIWRELAARDGDPRPFGQLKAVCHTCVDLLDITGAGAMLMANRTHQGTAYATDDRVRAIEDLQNAAGEGPCLDAYNLGRPVLADDLNGEDGRRWPLLTAAAMAAGIHALFAFPLQVDDVCLGAMDLYRDRPGPLSDDDVADARMLAAIATRAVLGMQADAPPESLPGQIADLSGDRAAIEQAVGMVAAQLDASVAEATHRLRAVAQEDGRALADLAHDVVARRVRLDRG